jgi:hypothetical protein
MLNFIEASGALAAGQLTQSQTRLPAINHKTIHHSNPDEVLHFVLETP